MNKSTFAGLAVPIVMIVLVLVGSRFYESVPPGHVAVATLFGDVLEDPYEAGLHIPVNPLRFPLL